MGTGITEGLWGPWLEFVQTLFGKNNFAATDLFQGLWFGVKGVESVAVVLHRGTPL